MREIAMRWVIASKQGKHRDLASVLEKQPLEFEIEDQRAARSRELENASRLDVHTWSDHPEVNAFVRRVYDAYFKGRKANIARKHLKVVLLHLYVSWSEDPTRKTAFSRNSNDYVAGSFYNELHISELTIKVVDTLIDAGLIEQAIGFYDHDRGGGKVSRIWPTPGLVEMFHEARFGPLDVGNHAGRIAVVLRDLDADADVARDIPYVETDDTRRMSLMLDRYNSLLARTFVDIPTLDAPVIPAEHDGPSLIVSQRDKFVRRVFNRGSFEMGGRFYGGWWQRCPKDFRKKIFLDDWPTSEVDFSGLHLILLYAMQGIDYWAERDDDPYHIDVPQFLDNQDQTRAVAKALVLVALNASSAAQAFGAFRHQAARGSLEKKLTDDQLRDVLGKIELKHPDVADYFFTDSGIGLMAIDAKITEQILEHFTAKSIPVLSLHDSYIVPTGFEDELTTIMRVAFEAITGVPLSGDDKSIKEISNRVEDLEAALHIQMKVQGVWSHAEEEASLVERRYPERTGRYRAQWQQFQEWRGRTVLG